jgi:iron complex outermembrane recepter protein
VLMHTRKPLELDANTVSVSGGFNYNDQAEDEKPSVSGLYSWKNSAETWGVTVAAQHYEEQVDRQGAEIFGYVPASTFTNVTGVSPTAKVPNFINAAWFQQDRERDSLAVNLQLKPNDQLELNVSGLYIKEDFANYNQSMYNFLSLRADEVDQLTGSGGVITGGHSGPDSVVFYDNNVRASKPTTKGLDLQAAWYGEGWKLSGQLGQSKADNDLKQWFIEPAFTGGFSWDIKRGITFDDPAAARNPANWVAEGFFGNHGIFNTEAKDTYGQADFTLDLGGMFDSLAVGVRRHKHEEDFTLNVYGIPPVGDLSRVGTIGLTDIQGFAPDQSRHIYAGRNNVRNWVIGAPPNFANPDAASFLNNTFHVEQTNTAAYGQLNFGKGERLHGNFGVRFVKAEIESTAFDLGSDVPTLPAQPQWLVTQKNDNNYVLPSVNLAFDATNDVVLRFAAAKVVAWAPYNQMAPNTFLNDTTLTGTGGNADIGPYESTNYNVSAEWYFTAESVLAASVFYKDIKNFIENEAGVERQFNSISDDADPTAFQNLVATGACSNDGFCNYSILRPRNAGNGEIKGLNLSYQQPFGQTGFGVTANYTYADGKTAAGNDLPFQSENQYNISPYYERDPFSARVTYGWRSEYLAGGFVAGAPPVSVDAYADLGLSLGWKFNEMWQLNFDAQNLLDEEYFQYFQEKNQPANRYKTGRRFQASVQVKF